MEGLGKAECSEYRLYKTGFYFRAAGRRQDHPGHGQETSFPGLALPLSPQVTLDQSQAALGLTFSLCEMRESVGLHTVPSSTYNFRILGLGGPGELGLREVEW